MFDCGDYRSARQPNLLVSSRVLGRDCPGLSFPLCMADRSVSLSQRPRPCPLSRGGIANSKVDRDRVIVSSAVRCLQRIAPFRLQFTLKRIVIRRGCASSDSGEMYNWSNQKLRIRSFPVEGAFHTIAFELIDQLGV